MTFSGAECVGNQRFLVERSGVPRGCQLQGAALRQFHFGGVNNPQIDKLSVASLRRELSNCRNPERENST